MLFSLIIYDMLDRYFQDAYFFSLLYVTDIIIKKYVTNISNILIEVSLSNIL